MEIKDKKFLIAGTGLSGMAAAKTLLNREAQVCLYDKKTAEKISPAVKSFAEENRIVCYWGRCPDSKEKFDYLILSPGIPLTEDIVLFAKENCKETIGELELAYRISKGKFIAVTGTNGKTTTTTLVGEIISLSGRNNYVVGNIGVPAISAAERSTDNTWFTAEVSSFQLETIKDFKPEVSAILNVTPDHLNRHKTMAGYKEAKAAIYKNQTKDNYFVVNRDCEEAWEMRKNCPAVVVPFSAKAELDFGCFVRNEKILIRDADGEEIVICRFSDIKIPGGHNVENVLAAVAICYFSGITPPIIRRGIEKFEGVEHRIEFVKEINGVKYYNDSKGTNTDASKKAIDALKNNIILIAGGYDKKEAFDSFIEYFDGRVKHMLLIGTTAPIIAAACDSKGFKDYTFKDNMYDCVKSAYSIAQTGDIVLLSPACASWGMYNNFEERGRDFKKCVESLGGK